MTENLHKKLTDVLSGAGIRPALSEDETNLLPYVTFELPVEYRYDKDGPYKIVGNLTIRAVSDDFDEADGLCGRIMAAVDEGFNGVVGEEEDIEVVDGGDPEGSNPGYHEEDGPDDSEQDPEPNPSDNPSDPEPEDPEAPVVEEPDDPGQDPGQDPEYAEEDDAGAEIVDDSSYSARLTDIRKDCMDGIWVIELDYILNQYA